ncbi:hypothetical protein HELRODRAFT_169350 [Helobdella robusta]|uniref:V-type proton ATPase subunit E n=1 Tax=Helobdella robusta TaxID=6412 RepID=T1F1T6_HELRO|nr:hypothetical protein HELRODRAFT_169350 [Helobdella robusta]ESO08494.1 hypothetical protein HELRODRAFT_169350 [Helobdella robusta]
MTLSDDKVKNQIQHMIAFIEQEANEKVEEIITKAEEEFNIEKSSIVNTQRVKIMEFYQKKQKQTELNKKIQTSNLLNNARLKVLKAREDHIKNILDETQRKLLSISNNAAQYKKLLEGLISQGLFQLLEDKVEIKCRKCDVALVEEILPTSVNGFKKLTGKAVSATINKSSFLSSECTGGVEMTSHDGKIRVINTLESRLELISQQVFPELKEMLFGVNMNRKFRD